MKASTDLSLNTKDGNPSPSGHGTVELKIKKGDKIPDKFIPSFLLYNREYIADLPYKDGVPQLTKDEEKKYGVVFKPEGAAPMKITKRAYNLEKLTEKLASLGETKFKEWCETKFGEDEIDRRKSGKAIIVQVLNDQEAARR